MKVRYRSPSRPTGAVLVHARDAAKRFYMKCTEFVAYPESSRTLFLPIKNVVAAFGWS